MSTKEAAFHDPPQERTELEVLLAEEVSPPALQLQETSLAAISY